jgi:hypothetical protein
MWRAFKEECMRTDVLYAKTDEGVVLAVVDVTNPAFAVSVRDGELAAMAKQYVQEAAEQREIPVAVREALRNSMLGRGLLAAAGTFLDGMSTYLLKLGPENLGEAATPIDRRIAASFPAFTVRIRLTDMARLLADGLAPGGTTPTLRKILLVNIGGGPASDSWNALLVLKSRLRAEPHSMNAELVAGPRVVVAVPRSALGPSTRCAELRHLYTDWTLSSGISATRGRKPTACEISSRNCMPARRPVGFRRRGDCLSMDQTRR